MRNLRDEILKQAISVSSAILSTFSCIQPSIQIIPQQITTVVDTSSSNNVQVMNYKNNRL
jgi:hypothetical protein